MKLTSRRLLLKNGGVVSSAPNRASERIFRQAVLNSIPPTETGPLSNKLNKTKS
jgi:hypothetical protein